MKHLLLVNPPNHERDTFDVAPPLGLMVLADLALREGWEATLLDFNVAPAKDSTDDPERFYRDALRRVLEANPDLVGLTSMGVNSHVTLLLARAIKQANPEIYVALGGPHLSSIHDELIELWPWFDAIIVGEGEAAFITLLRRLRSEGRPGGAGRPIVLREPFTAPPRHPFSAYGRLNLETYFQTNSRRLINYEGGRGCIFKCSFCYSPSHHDAVRNLMPQEIVEDFRRLVDLGAGHVFQVQDNFTNVPAHAIAVCDALAAAKLPLTWDGYATLPQLSREVIRALGRSGCSAIYLGVDAVTEKQKVSFNKRFFRKEEDLLSKLRELLDNGVLPTCAFIVDLYAHNPDDVEQVLRTAATCAATGAVIRINTFTRYPSTGLGRPAANAVRYSEAKIRAVMDCPGVVRQNELGRLWPSLFPFHASEIADEKLWASMLRLIRTAARAINEYPAYFASIPASARAHVLTAAAMAISESGETFENSQSPDGSVRSPSQSEFF